MSNDQSQWSDIGSDIPRLSKGKSWSSNILLLYVSLVIGIIAFVAALSPLALNLLSSSLTPQDDKSPLQGAEELTLESSLTPDEVPIFITNLDVPPKGVINDQISFSATIPLTNISNVKYSWDYGDGEQSELSGDLGSQHTYENIGDYLVTLYVIYQTESGEQRQTHATRLIRIAEQPISSNVDPNAVYSVYLSPIQSNVGLVGNQKGLPFLVTGDLEADITDVQFNIEVTGGGGIIHESEDCSSSLSSLTAVSIGDIVLYCPPINTDSGLGAEINLQTDHQSFQTTSLTVHLIKEQFSVEFNQVLSQQESDYKCVSPSSDTDGELELIPFTLMLNTNPNITSSRIYSIEFKSNDAATLYKVNIGADGIRECEQIEQISISSDGASDVYYLNVVSVVGVNDLFEADVHGILYPVGKITADTANIMLRKISGGTASDTVIRQIEAKSSEIVLIEHEKIINGLWYKIIDLSDEPEIWVGSGVTFVAGEILLVRVETEITGSSDGANNPVTATDSQEDFLANSPTEEPPGEDTENNQP